MTPRLPAVGGRAKRMQNAENQVFSILRFFPALVWSGKSFSVLPRPGLVGQGFFGCVLFQLAGATLIEYLKFSLDIFHYK